ncbi:MAG: DUF4292 domain-containing protein [Smithellaceae bacterium]|nr:DUF4292 domain-containing protein [Smithellaceae bacterium]
MRDRYFPCGRVVIFLWLVMLVCGCAGKTAGMPPKSLEIISRTIHETDRIVATAQIDLMTAQGYFPVRAALVLQKPSYLRLEMLPLIGTPDFFLTATPDDMRIFIPSRGEFYSGKPSAENLARFLTFALNIADMVMILSGSYPPLAKQNLLYMSYEEADLLRVDMKTPLGPSQTIWMEKNGRIARLVRHDSDGREIYQVQYEDYTPQGPLAEKITIKWTDNVTSVSVKYSDLRIEKATDLSVFELPVPAEIKIIKMN